MKETAALGVATNIDFLSRLLTSEPYLNGEIKTDFFAKSAPAVQKPPLTPEGTCMLVSAAIIARFDGYEEGHREPGWQGTYHKMKYAGFLLHGTEHSAAYRKKDKDRFEIAFLKDTLMSSWRQKQRTILLSPSTGGAGGFRMPMTVRRCFSTA